MLFVFFWVCALGFGLEFGVWCSEFCFLGLLGSAFGGGGSLAFGVFAFGLLSVCFGVAFGVLESGVRCFASFAVGLLGLLLSGRFGVLAFGVWSRGVLIFQCIMSALT